MAKKTITPKPTESELELLGILHRTRPAHRPRPLRSREYAGRPVVWTGVLKLLQIVAEKGFWSNATSASAPKRLPRRKSRKPTPSSGSCANSAKNSLQAAPPQLALRAPRDRKSQRRRTQGHSKINRETTITTSPLPCQMGIPEGQEMMSPITWLSREEVVALEWTLLTFCWQGTASNRRSPPWIASLARQLKDPLQHRSRRTVPHARDRPRHLRHGNPGRRRSQPSPPPRRHQHRHIHRNGPSGIQPLLLNFPSPPKASKNATNWLAMRTDRMLPQG